MTDRLRSIRDLALTIAILAAGWLAAGWLRGWHDSRAERDAEFFRAAGRPQFPSPFNGASLEDTLRKRGDDVDASLEYPDP